MKFREFLNETQLTLEQSLKKVRDLVRKKDSGVGPEGKKKAEKIIDTLLACSTDKETFGRFYEKFGAEDVDAFDFVMEEVFSYMGVKTYEELEAKAFSVKEALDRKALPKGYTISAPNSRGFRFVKTPDGKLVPNQGTLKPGKKHTDAEIISDFYIWFDKKDNKGGNTSDIADQFSVRKKK